MRISSSASAKHTNSVGKFGSVSDSLHYNSTSGTANQLDGIQRRHDGTPSTENAITGVQPRRRPILESNLFLCELSVFGHYR